MDTTDQLTVEAIPESALVDFVVATGVADLPDDVTEITRQVLLTVIGTAVAGSAQDGISELRDFLRTRSGAPDARAIPFGDRLPAASAALLGGATARALDYCDAMVPGLHLGSAVVPAALAAAELVGDVSGQELLTALTIGMEVGARLNLPEEVYDGYDPTGIAGTMASAAAVARVLRLDREQTWNALALAFNRCGGSFQSNIDGSLAVRLIQGWVASDAVECCQFAQLGLTGPRHFLSGTYGYAHLYGRGRVPMEKFVAGLSQEWHLDRMVFKQFPSCGLTQGVTQLAVDALAAGISLDQVAHARAVVPPYSWRLVGQPFAVGATPRVNAQFSAQYCVASTLARTGSRLTDFEPAAINELVGSDIMARVTCDEDEALDEISHTACSLTLTLHDGQRWEGRLDIAPGFPGNELPRTAHRARFLDCWSYAPDGRSEATGVRVADMVEGIADLADVNELLAAVLTP